MSFGAIGVEIMAKIKIMRVVIGFTKKEKRKRGNNHVKKEISSGNSSSNRSNSLLSSKMVSSINSCDCRLFMPTARID